MDPAGSPHQDLLRAAATEVVKAAPPVTVYALTLNDWLAAATIFYVLLQASYLVWRWRNDVVRRRTEKEALDQLMQGRVARPGERAPS